MTSLSRQLENLKDVSLPNENGVLCRYSLLHDARNVKKVTLETALYDARASLEELVIINKNFSKFVERLFGFDSASVSRVNMNKEENLKLSKNIKKFLYLLSPYLLLTTAHVALEWLIFKYSINIYDEEIYVLTMLPYHETNLFARAIMLLECKNPTSRFHWLHSVQVSGTPIVRDTIYRYCLKNKWFLIKYFSFINDLAKYLEKKNESGASYSVIFGFFSMIVVEVIELDQNAYVKEIIDQLLPFLIDSLSSSIINYIHSSLLIINKLVSVAKLRTDCSQKFVKLIVLNSNLDKNTRFMSVLNIFYTQKMNGFTDNYVLDLVTDDNGNDFFDQFSHLNLETFMLAIFKVMISKASDDQIDKLPLEWREFLRKSLIHWRLEFAYFDHILTAEKPCKAFLKDVSSFLFIERGCLIDYSISLNHAKAKQYVSECAPTSLCQSNEVKSQRFSALCIETLSDLSKISDSELKRRISSLVNSGDHSLFIVLAANLHRLNKVMSGTDIRCVTHSSIDMIVSKPLEFIDFIKNNMEMETVTQLMSFIFSEPWSVAFLVPSFIKEMSSKGSNKGVIDFFRKNLKSPSSSEVQCSKIISFSNIEELIKNFHTETIIKNLIDAIGELKDQRWISLLLIIISRNLPTSKDLLCAFINKINYLIRNYLDIRSLINGIRFNKKAGKKLLSNLALDNQSLAKVFTRSIFYSLSMVSRALSLCEDLFEPLLAFLKICILGTYSSVFHATFNKCFKSLLTIFVNKQIIMKEKFHGVIVSIIISLIDADFHNPGPENLALLICFIRFYHDLLVGNAFNQSLDAVDTAFILISLLQSKSKEVRISSIEALSSLRSLTTDSEITDLLSLIHEDSLLLVNDDTRIILLFMRLIRSCSSIVDKLMDLSLRYSENVNFGFLNLFSVKCLSLCKSNETIVATVAKYIKCLNLCASNISSEFCNLFHKILIVNSPVSCKNETIFDTLLAWTTSNSYSEFIIEKFDPNLFPRFDKNQQNKLIISWLTKISDPTFQNGELLLQKFTKLQIDSNLLAQLLILSFTKVDKSAEFLSKHKSDITSITSDNVTSEMFLTLLEILSHDCAFKNQIAILNILLDCANYFSLTPDSSSDLIKNKSAFQLLNICLSIVSRIVSDICKSNAKRLTNLQNSFNLRHIVDILRRNNNSEAVEHCFSILSRASELSPDLLLNYIMPLFTFMGSYSFKKDNEETLNIISRAIRIIIPSMYQKLSNNVDDGIFKIVDTFAISFAHVPKHRHQPLFESLVSSLPSENSLGIVIYSLILHTNDVDHFYDFINDLCCLFPLDVQMEAISYILLRIDQMNDESSKGVGSKRKKPASDDFDPKVFAKTFKLVNVILTSKHFSDNILSLNPSEHERFNKSLLSVIKLLIDRQEEFCRSVDLTLYTSCVHSLIENVDPTSFVDLLKPFITGTQPTFSVSILLHWSTSLKHQCYNSEECFIDLTRTLIASIFTLHHSQSNFVTLAKKCIFVIKNLILMFKRHQSSLVMFELLTSIKDLIGYNLSICSSLALALSDCFSSISNVAFTHIPKILSLCRHIQLLFAGKNNQIHGEILFKCLRTVFEKSSAISETYISDIFMIISDTATVSKNAFDDFSAKNSANRLCKYDRLILELLNSLASKIDTIVLLASLHDFLLTNFGGSGLILHLLTIHIHIKKINLDNMESKNHVFTKLFELLISYRDHCEQNSSSSPFYINIETTIIVLLFEYSLKQPESYLMDFYSRSYERAVSCNVSLIKNNQLITFYQLTQYLLEKMGNIMIPHVSMLSTYMLDHFNHILAKPKFIKRKKFELFTSLAKTIKLTLMYDTDSVLPLPFLTKLITILSDSLKLSLFECSEVTTCLYEQIVPSCGYLAVCLNTHTRVHDVISSIQSLLNDKFEPLRHLAISAIKQVFKNLPDQAPILYPQVSSAISPLHNDPSEPVRRACTELTNLIQEFSM